MYETYWKLSAKPFQNTPDPRFIYYSGQHQDAQLKLEYAIKEGLGAAVLSGIFGCGKTILLYALLKGLNPEKYQTAYIAHPNMDQVELLMSIVSALGDTGLPQKRTEVLRNVIIDRLRTILLNHEREGKKTIIIIDEAHLLTDPLIFEELRLLLNMHLEDKFLLTLVLSGQPDLRHKIENLPQFEQRVSVKCHLTNLSRVDTQTYIRHRLKIAGANHSANGLFTPQALDRIYEYSGGIPRRINRLCDLSLLAGFNHKTKHIDERIIEEQARDLGRVETGALKSPSYPGVGGLFQPVPEPSSTPAPVSRAEPTTLVQTAPPAPRILEEPAPVADVTEIKTIPQERIPDRTSAVNIPRLDDEASHDLYAALLLLVENLFNRVKSGERINTQTAAPLINRLIDKITAGDHTLVALAMKPSYRAEISRKDYLAAHSVNVAILSILIGHTLGRDKDSLMRLGLGALLHDIGMGDTQTAPPEEAVFVMPEEEPLEPVAEPAPGETKTDPTGAKYISQLEIKTDTDGANYVSSLPDQAEPESKIKIAKSVLNRVTRFFKSKRE